MPILTILKYLILWVLIYFVTYKMMDAVFSGIVILNFGTRKFMISTVVASVAVLIVSLIDLGKKRFEIEGFENDAEDGDEPLQFYEDEDPDAGILVQPDEDLKVVPNNSTQGREVQGKIVTDKLNVFDVRGFEQPIQVSELSLADTNAEIVELERMLKVNEELQKEKDILDRTLRRKLKADGIETVNKTTKQMVLDLHEGEGETLVDKMAKSPYMILPPNEWATETRFYDSGCNCPSLETPGTDYMKIPEQPDAKQPFDDEEEEGIEEFEDEDFDFDE